MHLFPLCILLLSSILVKSQNVSTAVECISDGNNYFASNLYSKIILKEKGNLFFSPFSIESVLTITSLAAYGTTKSELQKVLQIPTNTKQIGLGYKTILGYFNNKSENYELFTANKIYVAKGFSINKNFSKVAADVFQSGIETVNFGDKIDTAQEINNWVESQTNSKIKNIVSPDSISALTKLLLVNTLYFNSPWKIKFNTNNTYKQPFFTSQNISTNVDMMHLEDDFLIYDSSTLKATFLQLPYAGPNITMTIALPENRTGLAQLEKNIEEVLVPDYNYYKVRCIVGLPRFHIESTLKLVPYLQELGIKAAFDPNSANFTGFGNNNKNLFISDVLQKTFVNVTENGTEAAAATIVIHPTLAIAPPIIRVIEMDHPFIFFIKLNELILFVGRVRSF